MQGWKELIITREQQENNRDLHGQTEPDVCSGHVLFTRSSFCCPLPVWPVIGHTTCGGQLTTTDRVLPSYIQSNRPTAAFAPESQSAATHLPVLEIYVNVLTAALQIRPLTWRLFRLQSYQETVNNWQKTWALLFFAFFIFLASARLFHRLSSLTTWSNFTLSIPEGHFSLKSSSGKMLLTLMKVFL